MKNQQIKNNVFIAGIVILLIWIIYYYGKIIFFWYDINNVTIPSQEDILTWLNIDWNTNVTWLSIDSYSTDIDKYNFIVNNTTNFHTIKLGSQPNQSYWDYQKNTELLRSYAISNMQTFDMPKISWWYLYIKLKNKLPTNRSAVIYIQTKLFQCAGWIKESLPTNYNTEYLYSLNDVNLVWVKCWKDILSHISWNDITVGGYVWTFDWNWIQEITIARY